MEHIYFFTGFPGFISNQLIRELVRRDEAINKIHLLVLSQQREKAEMEIKRIEADLDGMKIAFEIVIGDITKGHFDCSLDVYHELQQQVTHLFHLAAIYDLAVEEKLARLVNVVGTKQVNEWAKGVTGLKRYTYFSTAYVAGMREGSLYEDELELPKSFKNHYERTKYEAEVLVEELKKEIPITIIRPGIVKGHSQTGQTIKFDGPYFILNFLDRLSFLPFFPYISSERDTVVNLVPIDYIIQATAFLALYKEGAGKTYHLTDPNPCTASEIYELFVEELYNKKPKGHLPLSLSQAFLSIRQVRAYLGVEKEALDYFTWKGHFDCSLAQADLTASGIVCPDFKEGVPAMVDFYLQHKRDEEYQIKIR
ncbi:SDR family oxidoreductase [Peribacillus muralis]|uniref:SDR family oxidoreductase n=1 Tax=Peribacillus muralis TaxID=264697 RepID=UPI001F4DD6FF|nr:SDR family oxidoreductase [Peribacillus muralis]MCK1992718.1 SDR family oxidoreductase [Peribacillus muralis]MCK2013273.1 SDR family oxidoreductase [Peribacillus muralis]